MDRRRYAADSSRQQTADGRQAEWRRVPGAGPCECIRVRRECVCGRGRRLGSGPDPPCDEAAHTPQPTAHSPRYCVHGAPAADHCLHASTVQGQRAHLHTSTAYAPCARRPSARCRWALCSGLVERDRQRGRAARVEGMPAKATTRANQTPAAESAQAERAVPSTRSARSAHSAHSAHGAVPLSKPDDRVLQHSPACRHAALVRAEHDSDDAMLMHARGVL